LRTNALPNEKLPAAVKPPKQTKGAGLEQQNPTTMSMQYETEITKPAPVRPPRHANTRTGFISTQNQRNILSTKFLENESYHCNDQENENFSVLPCNQLINTRRSFNPQIYNFDK
jgi:hypothetical protein